MAYFSLKNIGTLAILPMITLASVASEAHAAPKVRALSQSQRGQVFPVSRLKRQQLTTIPKLKELSQSHRGQDLRRSRVFNQKLTTPTNLRCDDSLVVAVTQYNHSSGGLARQAGVKEWEIKAHFAYPGNNISWNSAASKSIQTRSKEIYVPNHGWNGNGVGSVQRVWQATVKGIPCDKIRLDPPAIP